MPLSSMDSGLMDSERSHACCCTRGRGTACFFVCLLTSSWLSSMKSNMWLSCILANCLPSSMAFSHI
ncbi:hypothetical protein EYF80_019136 [Liparis tanakae]|uniref:Uncharacterized protein n=1 Tax=Liparis tanakae TaxID=230148 RepID=A0A4Z2HXY2_9TELE|nr:hypothetical protein EYF80_019136 [Liparis tanakae]